MSQVLVNGANMTGCLNSPLCDPADAACVAAFEVALCDFFCSRARSTNKQLANRKSTWYLRGQNPGLKSPRLFVFDRFCLFGEVKATAMKVA